MGGSVSEKKSLKMVNLCFRLPYYTQWGQSILVSGSEPLLGSWNVKKGVLLSPFHQGGELVWCGRIAVPKGFTCEYSYYLVDDDRKVLRWEGGKKRKFSLPEGIQEGEIVELRDLWQTASEAVFFRSAFKNVIFRDGQKSDLEVPPGTNQKSLDSPDTVAVQFNISYPNIGDGSSVYVVGSSSQLGGWKEHGLKLSYAGESLWQADCVIWKYEFPIKYPFHYYCQYDNAGNISLEPGPNRELIIEPAANSLPRCISLADGTFREKPWRGAGVAIPMFSVRSDDDLGVGEFLDLKLLVDWAVESGFHLVQLLPVNDTSVHGMWWDSYPYSSLSVFALHPLYLRVQALSKNIPEDIKREILKEKECLAGKDVDYEATMVAKLSIARKIFSIEKDNVLSSSSFQKFLSENEEWLKPYAAFCFLRDFFETSDHSQWGRFGHFSKETLEKLVSEGSLQYDIICFHYYIQYHLYLQLSEAAAYAREKKVVLKGDLPIGVDRNSVDTWVYPNLFRMNTSTGAPPDYFDKNGQNWGFPTYNWEEMSKDNYSWWRARLTQMAKYFTAYRIDHILGFFRIWELPEHAVTGLIGKFRPSIALSQEELEREGIWDFDRLSQPYVRQQMLLDKFSVLWAVIASVFFEEYQKQCYKFKEDCNTEKKILSKLKSCPDRSLWADKEDKIQKELFDLLKNIVLIRDPEDARKFYPRFNIDDTSSFKDLDDHSKNVLRRLYHDYYFVRQDELWRENALKTLPVLLNSSDMLACGEDLGFIPSCVHPVMQELGLIGLRIQRMPNEPDLEFGIPSNYSYMTVCAPSCHDCSTMRAWWEEDAGRKERFYKTVVGSEEVPPSSCIPEVAFFILRQHFDAPSMWAIFPVQDLLALKEDYTTRPAAEETINDPTNPKHYWRFRLHVTLETLLKDKELTQAIKDLVVSSGRSYPGTGRADTDSAPGKVLGETTQGKISQVVRSNGTQPPHMAAAWVKLFQSEGENSGEEKFELLSPRFLLSPRIEINVQRIQIEEESSPSSRKFLCHHVHPSLNAKYPLSRFGEGKVSSSSGNGYCSSKPRTSFRRYPLISSIASDSASGRRQMEIVYDPEERINRLADEVDKEAGLSRLSLFSPCKINVFLRITRKREDGFHDLASLFHVISLGDTIKFSLSPTKNKDRLSTNVPGVPLDEKNLIIKALKLYREKTGSDNFFWIHLDKKVPTGAGLGGGSSNAATALWAANQFNNCAATEKELQEWSAEIGSDIPFFFSNGAAYCTGRGEVVQDIPSPIPLDTPMVLIKPPQACPTAEVYKRLRLDQTSSVDPMNLLEKISGKGISQDVCINDLELPAFEVLPTLKRLKQRILAASRRQYDAVFMSGSGSTIVGVGSPEPPQFLYDENEYEDTFISEARFVTRGENQWYIEPNTTVSPCEMPAGRSASTE
ncbi:hypothetical protein H6P81_007698 [Aristolochia fimbriata]|uniref:4-(cytidine-5'-diphospho)-2-C-methyl-D-erythritol kinase n=1 Tax=Aristolochia fimbriata TaxID=158543 RepID=A0AAV7F2A3_ARIFI|nr:hypothetical protein H6P81_007698 [Aristolochia fimbriata]